MNKWKVTSIILIVIILSFIIGVGIGYMNQVSYNNGVSDGMFQIVESQTTQQVLFYAEPSTNITRYISLQELCGGQTR